MLLYDNFESVLSCCLCKVTDSFCFNLMYFLNGFVDRIHIEGSQFTRFLLLFPQYVLKFACSTHRIYFCD